MLLAVAKGQQEPALDKAVFGAEKGELTGPVKTQFGYYVFEVTKVTPKSQQTLQQASQTIKGILASENQQKALDKFIKDFQKEWKEKTNCRKGYVTQDCKNAPKAKTTVDDAARARSRSSRSQPQQPGQPRQPGHAAAARPAAAAAAAVATVVDGAPERSRDASGASTT